ncbi:hypothetical protein [Nitrincola sp. MINF-07-Sa-05]|uniref:hypothetical protein n=1 Tax=Nitrincola salilacus TaxID=3400273 RepID=UPI00391832DF
MKSMLSLFNLKVLMVVPLCLPTSSMAESSLIDRYMQALEEKIIAVQVEVEVLGEILDRATLHPGFVTGDLWNIPSGLYTEEHYSVVSNNYPLSPFWEKAVLESRGPGNFVEHRTNYRRTINGVELLPGNVTRNSGLGMRARDRLSALSKLDRSWISANMYTGLTRYMEQKGPNSLKQFGLDRMSLAEREEFDKNLEENSGIKPLLDLMIEKLFIEGLDKLYGGRVTYGNMSNAQTNNAGLMRCMKSLEDAYEPALHRELLAKCDGQQLLDSYYDAYLLQSDYGKTPLTPYEFFRRNATSISFDLSYQYFVVSGYADERERFSQLYDLEQVLTGLVEKGLAYEEKHGSFRYFIDTQVGDGYPGAIAVDFDSGNGMWLTPLYMAGQDIAEQVARINEAITSTFELSRETFDIILDDFIMNYSKQRPSTAVQSDGF